MKKQKLVSFSVIVCLAMIVSLFVTVGAKTNINDKIVIHYKGEYNKPYIYYWNSLPENSETLWPGEEMQEDDDNWFTYSFDDVTKINFLFNDGNGQQTEDFTKKSGEYWYKDNEWYTENPDSQNQGNEGNEGDNENQASGGNSGVVDDYEYKEGKALGGDFRDDTIYFLMTTRFYDGYLDNNIHCTEDKNANNGDSDPAWRGDFDGLIKKLDYIKALGFSAIWVTPVVENGSGYDFHGYHAINMKRVDPRLESSGATYADLLDACHKKGIKVIQDIVLNHTSNSGEENLFPLLSKDYVLDKGVSGNSESYKVCDKNGLLPSNYSSMTPTDQYHARDNAMKTPDTIYRKKVDIGWEDFTVTTGQFAGDCMELNTENPTVYNYLTDAYTNYINMGVDAFRIDTCKHISRLTFNKTFIPAFKKAASDNGDDDFYMFGEVASRVSEVFNHGVPQVSPPYYTWKEDKDYAWNSNSSDGKDNLELCRQAYGDSAGRENQPTSDNGFLKGNDYHKPDYSKSSGLAVIDYAVHFNFENAGKAFQIAKEEDKYMNDPTWNVTYIDSHDYGPAINGDDHRRYNGSEEDFAENWNLMFTFRGIPCIYYGNEIKFQAGMECDKGCTAPLSATGRAYYGDNLEGEVNATGYGEYTASGTVANTLNSNLSKHLRTLNKIRRAIPALRRGQYSTEGCNGGISYKRRYTDANTDSFALVSISGKTDFDGIPNGEYTEVITGKTVSVTNGKLSSDEISKPNMRVYVLNTNKTKAPGKLSGDSPYLK